MSNEIKKFLPRFIRFVFPYSVLTVFTVIVFYKSGEIFWFNKTLQAQTIDRRNLICGTAYSNLPRYFKWAAIDNCKPKVIALGSSRVLQFRSEFFNDSISFYTTGGVFNRIVQLRAFLETIPENDLPKAIILGLDQWWFSARYDSVTKITDHLVSNSYSWFDNWSGLKNGWQKFYFDWWSGKIEWKKLWIENCSGIDWIGISARMESSGNRKDGSRAYGSALAGGTINSRIETAALRARVDEGLFKWTTQPDKNAVKELRLLLRFCTRHKITVTGFLPPMHGRILSELKKNQQRYANFFQLYNSLYPVFREYGFYVYDCTIPQDYGSNDSEMIDAVHGSEKSFLKLYLRLLRGDGYLNQYSDSVYLRTRLDSAKGNFSVFGN